MLLRIMLLNLPLQVGGNFDKGMTRDMTAESMIRNLFTCCCLKLLPAGSLQNNMLIKPGVSPCSRSRGVKCRHLKANSLKDVVQCFQHAGPD